MTPIIEVVRESWADDTVPLPAYESAGAAGADLRANFKLAVRSGVQLEPGAWALIPTGVRVAIPPGFEMQLRPRSGLALKHGITLLNTPGTIDSDYRGPLSVILVNHGDETFRVQHGERIAQAVVAPVVQMPWRPVDSLDQTERGEGGFGSTGRA